MQRKGMSFAEWFKVLTISAIMLMAMFMVLYGSWHLFIDTGRAIIHK